MDTWLVYLEEFQFLVSNFFYQTLKWQMSLCCVDPLQLLRNKELKQKLPFSSIYFICSTFLLSVVMKKDGLLAGKFSEVDLLNSQSI